MIKEQNRPNKYSIEKLKIKLETKNLSCELLLERPGTIFFVLCFVGTKTVFFHVQKTFCIGRFFLWICSCREWFAHLWSLDLSKLLWVACVLLLERVIIAGAFMMTDMKALMVKGPRIKESWGRGAGAWKQEEKEGERKRRHVRHIFWIVKFMSYKTLTRLLSSLRRERERSARAKRALSFFALARSPWSLVHNNSKYLNR